jgi:hypothetical protein
VSKDSSVFASYFCRSDHRHDYILKKYVEKRWAASSTIPIQPPDKQYRSQESQVVEFVTSGKFISDIYSHRKTSILEHKEYKLLKRENPSTVTNGQNGRPGYETILEKSSGRSSGNATPDETDSLETVRHWQAILTDSSQSEPDVDCPESEADETIIVKDVAVQAG